ncbi:ankyrin repeat domain-containing protein [Massilia forsythiae]|nr:ankyrin repeat domain-containing protein [Massilia forsythiae]
MMPRRTALRFILLAACLGAGANLAAAQPGMTAQPERAHELQRAVQMDDVRTLKSLLDAGFDANRQLPVGEPALVVAVREGSMKALRVLLDAPATRVDAPAVNGNTALMMAALKRNRPAAEALLARGAAADRQGWTPLHYAAAGGDVDIAALLLQHGARIDAVSPTASGSFTPLMMAAREGQEEAALFLLTHGANARLKNGEGLTAAQIAERADHKSIARALAR